MEVLSWKSPTLKHISEKISFRPTEFPGKVAHQRNSLLDRNGLALFQNSILDKNEPAMLIHWLEMVPGKHGLSIYRAAAGGCLSTMPL